MGDVTYTQLQKLASARAIIVDVLDEIDETDAVLQTGEHGERECVYDTAALHMVLAVLDRAALP